MFVLAQLSLENGLREFVMWVVVMAVGFIYLFPFGIATLRQHPAVDWIYVVNWLLGWTLIGWVVALAWAVSPIEQDEKDR